MDKILAHQFYHCCKAFYDIPQFDQIEDFVKNFDKSLLIEWGELFYDDIFSVKAGYSKNENLKTPLLEDQLIEIIQKSDLSSASKKNGCVPTIVLSHDIDYLRPTMQMVAKRAIGYRKLVGWRGNYIESIRKILEFDRSIVGERSSVVFIASPRSIPNPFLRAKQWVIDPSYNENTDLFKEFRELVYSNKPIIGIHGSYLSLSNGFLFEEVQSLERAFSSRVTWGRQHWLNVSELSQFEEVKRAGVDIDSSLGWNGGYGFRGGMSRPYRLVLPNQTCVWQIPLVLMDGPLFDDLKLSEDEVVDLSCAILEEVFKRNGCVSIDWHDRSAHKSFNWFGAYERIVKWAQKRGFRFSLDLDFKEQFLAG